MPSYRRNRDGSLTRVDRGYAKNQRNYQRGRSLSGSSYNIPSGYRGKTNPYYTPEGVKKVHLTKRDRAAVNRHGFTIANRQSTAASFSPADANMSTNLGPARAAAPSGYKTQSRMQFQSFENQSRDRPLSQGEKLKKFGTAAARGVSNVVDTLNDPNNVISTSIANRFQQDIYATLGIAVGGYTPDPDASYMVGVAPNIGSAAANGAKMIAKAKASDPKTWTNAKFWTAYKRAEAMGQLDEFLASFTKQGANWGSAGKTAAQTSIGTTPQSVAATSTKALVNTNTKTSKIMGESLMRKILMKRHVSIKIDPVTGVETPLIQLKSRSLLIKLGIFATAVAGIMSTWGFSKWQGKSEAPQSIGMAGYLYDQAGMQEEKIQMGYALHDALEDDDLITNGLRGVPGVSQSISTAETKKTMSYLADALIMTGENELAKANGASDLEIFNYRREMEFLDQEYNRLANLEYQEAVTALKAAAATADRIEELKFYEKQLQLRARFEDAERKKQLEYWETYWAMQAHGQVDNTPSRLNFGLL